ncbi:MAG: hypothetical protein IJD51_03715 [Clostridia bacterium]|nr:hypothetical protein [Clostridia bacterium]
MTYEEAVESFLDLWKEKGFRLDDAIVVATVAGTQEMHDNFGTSAEALKRITEFMRECATQGDVLGFALCLAGIEDYTFGKPRKTKEEREVAEKALPIIVDCIKELTAFKASLSPIEEKTKADEGYNCAVSCAKSSAQTRIDYLTEWIEDYSVGDDICEEYECYDCISSMIWVFNADGEPIEVEFDKGFSLVMQECIPKLEKLLKKYE